MIYIISINVYNTCKFSGTVHNISLGFIVPVALSKYLKKKDFKKEEKNDHEKYINASFFMICYDVYYIFFFSKLPQNL